MKRHFKNISESCLHQFIFHKNHIYKYLYRYRYTYAYCVCTVALSESYSTRFTTCSTEKVLEDWIIGNTQFKRSILRSENSLQRKRF